MPKGTGQGTGPAARGQTLPRTRNENTVRKSERREKMRIMREMRIWCGKAHARATNLSCASMTACAGNERPPASHKADDTNGREATRSRGGAKPLQDKRRARRKINADVLDEFIALQVVEDRILLVFGNPALTAERP